MPLTPTHAFTETEAWVEVTVDLKGASKADVDVYASDVLLKVNFSPYLLQLDLPAPVDDFAAAASFLDGRLVVRLPKVTPALWGALEVKGLSKAELRARRQESTARRSAKEAELLERKRELRHEEGRKVLRKQMDLEDAQRKHLEGLKKAEKDAAEAEVYSALSRFKSPPAAASAAPPAPAPATAPTPAATPAATPAPPAPPAAAPQPAAGDEARRAPSTAAASNSAIFADAPPPAGDDTPGAAPATSAAAPEHQEEEEEEEDEVAYIPPPRASNRVQLSFTARVFPTPMRESTQAEEEDWLAKNRHKMKRAPGDVKSKDRAGIEDRDPVWLKGKGDDFYRSNDFAAAANAYTAAIEADPTAVGCVSNRAACYLHLHRLEECVTDCSTALVLLSEKPPPGPKDPDARPVFPGGPTRRVRSQLRLLARRGMALSHLGRYSEALADFQSAGSIDRTDPAYAALAGRCSQLEEVAQWKTVGDTAFREGRLDDAVAQFQRVLTAEPRFVAARSNLAAAFLAQKQHAACITECGAALQLLGEEAAAELGGEGAEPLPPPHESLDPVPPRGSKRHATFVLRTHVRRGTALCQLDRYAEAVPDYEAAVSLDPKNQSLVTDMKRVRARATVSPSDL